MGVCDYVDESGETLLFIYNLFFRRFIMRIKNPNAKKENFIVAVTSVLLVVLLHEVTKMLKHLLKKKWIRLWLI